MDEILQILREEEATLNLPIKTLMDGINEAFYCKEKNEKQTRLCYICRKSNHLAKDCYYRNKNTLQVQAKETIRLEMDTYLQLLIEKNNFVTIPGSWIVVHPVIGLKNLCGSRILVQK
ncbi:hypothetical protein TNCV_3236261 [Trichonephila clavipes]|nr:hypothetical protein TNCV_3236261 [Trichonephila clavipes]